MTALLRRPAVAVLVLLLAYVGLSFANSPRGYLGTDTGGKVATLRVMDQRGRLDPDLGYWAASWDPEGRVFPFFSTAHIGRRWVNVTTLPALYAGLPLYRLGGYRLALLVPMLGALMAALAARAVARRLGSGDGWTAFWLVGLASPLAVYALDFWEHSLGVGLTMWAVVLLVDVADRRAGWRGAVGAGALVGAAATLRTEALVYGAVLTATVCLLIWWRRRRLLPAVVVGVAVVAGLVIPLAANAVLERQTAGGVIRSGRTAGAAASVAGDHATRGREAAMTAVALEPREGVATYAVGFVAVLLLGLVVSQSGGGGKRELAALAAAGVVMLYLLRLLDGSGFVPGLAAAAPLVVVGVVAGWKSPAARPYLVVALAALPMVWASQYPGGAAPQWGGRYLLISSALLVAVGGAMLPELARWARAFLVGLAVVVTAFGLSWLQIRSHGVARASQVVVRSPEPVLVWRDPFLAREFGDLWSPDRRWLSAVTAADQTAAAAVVTRAGFDRFGLIELEQGARTHDISGFRREGSRPVALFDGASLRITTYSRVP